MCWMMWRAISPRPYPMCGSSAVTMPMDPCANSLQRSSLAVMSFTHRVRRVDMPRVNMSFD